MFNILWIITLATSAYLGYKICQCDGFILKCQCDDKIKFFNRKLTNVY
jgi:hypothetical protein